jgi:GNAT superfamily N-acetyltransferase
MTALPSVHVRVAAPSEATLITPLCAEHAAYERSHFDDRGHGDRLRRLMDGPSPRVVIFVAEHASDGLLGYASVSRELATWRAAEYLHMDCLYVRQPFRGNNIGRALLDAVLGFARSAGLSEIQWQTPDWNDGAIRFYRSFGAVPAVKMRFSLAK